MAPMEYEIELCAHDRDDGAEYKVIIDGELFKTLVTHDPFKVETWIRDTELHNSRHLQRLVVGFDFEQRPNTISESNTVVVVVLVVHRDCLIYQFQQANQIPQLLKEFLRNPRYTFVGMGIGPRIGIDEDKQKMLCDYHLEVANGRDLREMAAYELEDPDLLKTGLKEIAKVVIGKDVGDHEEVEKVRMSGWENNRLSDEQVLYACLDGHLLFEMGRHLKNWYGP